jgi:hypothetical protein
VIVVRVYWRGFALEDVIGSHARSLEASKRVTNSTHLGCSFLLPVGTANYVQTLKVQAAEELAMEHVMLTMNSATTLMASYNTEGTAEEVSAAVCFPCSLYIVGLTMNSVAHQ